LKVPVASASIVADRLSAAREEEPVRFESRPACLDSSGHVRQLPPGCDLHRLFFHRLDRLVRRDSTFLLRNRLYEAPAHLASHTVEVRFDPVDGGAVEVWFEGKLQAAARPLDAVVNGQLPSAKPAAPPKPEPTRRRRA
jgi:hypothetical protein